MIWNMATLMNIANEHCWCQHMPQLAEHITWIFLFVTDCMDHPVNTLRPRQNGRQFADDTFKRIFFNENIRILIKISLKFVPKGLINNIPALVLIMAWRRPGDKLLSEAMMVRTLMHIYASLGLSELNSSHVVWWDLCPQHRRYTSQDTGDTRHSLHAGSGAGCVMYTLEGTKQSRSKPWTWMRYSQCTS